jgi:uncharacterized membrane protein YgcG
MTVRQKIVLGITLVFAAAVYVPQLAYAGVNDFVISSFDSQMTLGRNAENRSTLKTTETIVAGFPEFDQNHGLERAIPKEYDGHATNLQIQSVTDENGTARTYSTYDDSNGNLIVRMADMNAYVHGQQIYVLTYTQQDVTKHFSDKNDDEFYWDINGTEWKVPIGQLSLTLTLQDPLAKAHNGQNSCYEGAAKSTQECTITQNGSVISAATSDLAAGENMTVAVGFAPHTFVEYQRTFVETLLLVWVIMQIVAGVILLVALIWISVAYYRWRYRTREEDPVAPEYIPPKDASVSAAATTMPGLTAVGTAQLIDLAVRRYIRLSETKGSFGSHDYTIEVVKDITQLGPEETELLSDIYKHMPVVGEKFELKKLKQDYGFGTRVGDNQLKVQKLAKDTYGLFEKNDARKKMYRRWAMTWLIIGIVLLTIPFIFLAIALFAFSFFATQLTDRGLALRRYMLGLKMYIKVAETERLKMSQSPEAVSALAEFDAEGESKMLRLYERLLPYAILFGEEKNWSAELGKYYEKIGTQPDWYVGQTAFNAVMFSSAMHSMSQSMNSYAGGSGSSSGGAGGGGFSGGGGGGGGGGGV